MPLNKETKPILFSSWIMPGKSSRIAPELVIMTIKQCFSIDGELVNVVYSRSKLCKTSEYILSCKVWEFWRKIIVDTLVASLENISLINLSALFKTIIYWTGLIWLLISCSNMASHWLLFVVIDTAWWEPLPFIHEKQTFLFYVNDVVLVQIGMRTKLVCIQTVSLSVGNKQTLSNY